MVRGAPPSGSVEETVGEGDGRCGWEGVGGLEGREGRKGRKRRGGHLTPNEKYNGIAIGR